ncbi:MAG: type II toxin-antitoxin system Phd/YefM family antitoxin [Rhodocyclaceae bacterium]|nr:type II toxin-antitoxin system Phd/YefM family antitoxin [Rhodocyclaceae bacterium]
MHSLTLTSLRKNLFQLADQVLTTGEPVIIERHGRRLALVAEPVAPEAPPKKLRSLENLPKRKLYNGDDDDLAEFKVWDISEWREPEILSGSD